MATAISTGEGFAYLSVWLRSSQMQAARILESPGGPSTAFDTQADSLLFVIALRNVRRSVDLIRKTTADRGKWSDIDKAVNAFTKIVPDVVDLRDVIEHFDAYATGVGNLSRQDAPVSWYERGAESYKLVVLLAPGSQPISVDVSVALDAAGELAAAIESVFVRD